MAEAARRGLRWRSLALGGERMERPAGRLAGEHRTMGRWAVGSAAVGAAHLRCSGGGRLLRQTPPMVWWLIDSMGAQVQPGAHLRRRLPKVSITYYIAPQEWAVPHR